MNTLDQPPARQPDSASRTASAPDSSSSPRRRGGWKYGLLALVVLALALLAGFLPRWRAQAGLRAQTEALSLPTVTVLTPKPAAKETTLSLAGEIRPFVEAPIYARTSGYLKMWAVDLGAKVKAGDLLAEIDAPEVDQQLRQARAQLVAAEAGLKLAQATAGRFDTLRKTSVVSAQDKDEKDADASSRDAGVEAARANVLRLEELQSFQRIVAPFEGVITARNTDVGQLIAAGSGQALFTLAQAQTLRVFVRVPQAASRQIAPGQSAEVRLAEYPGRKFAAEVVRTAGAIDLTSRTLLVELSLDNTAGEILAGSHAQVGFILPSSSQALVLPGNTLLFRAEGTQVGLVDAGGSVTMRSVQLGRDFGREVEILSGLAPTDRVVLNPSDSLVSGAKVKIAPDPKAGE